MDFTLLKKGNNTVNKILLLDFCQVNQIPSGVKVNKEIPIQKGIYLYLNFIVSKEFEIIKILDMFYIIRYGNNILFQSEYLRALKTLEKFEVIYHNELLRGM